MNRLQLPDIQSVLTDPPRQDESDSGYSGTGDSLAGHSLFVPLHYEPNYAYPLLVWLPNPAGDHRQLNQVMPHVSLRNYVAIAPAGPGSGLEQDPVCEPKRSASTLGRASLAGQVAVAAQWWDQIQTCVDLAKQRYNIHSERVFLAGYGQAGTLALRIGLLMAEEIAGVASLGGGLPQGEQPLARWESARGLNLLVAHGRDSLEYPVEQVCDELRLAHAAGIRLALRQYSCGQELTTQMLTDLDAWMMERVTGDDSWQHPVRESRRVRDCERN